jgi:hypothetical protein
MTTMTEPHDSLTCQLGADGGPCEMCEIANRQQLDQEIGSCDHGFPLGLFCAVCREEDETEMDFEMAWHNAPRSMRNYVEREVAQFFYLLGRKDGHAKATETQHADLQEMQRLVEGRVEG